MASRDYCPLLDSGHGAVSFEIPRFCRENCQESWDKSTHNNVGTKYDQYDDDLSDKCSHEDDITIEFSYDGLIAVDGVLRKYVVVYSCGECDIPVEETARPFVCNKPEN